MGWGEERAAGGPDSIRAGIRPARPPVWVGTTGAGGGDNHTWTADGDPRRVPPPPPSVLPNLRSRTGTGRHPGRRRSRSKGRWSGRTARQTPRSLARAAKAHPPPGYPRAYPSYRHCRRVRALFPPADGRLRFWLNLPPGFRLMLGPPRAEVVVIASRLPTFDSMTSLPHDAVAGPTKRSRRIGRRRWKTSDGKAGEEMRGRPHASWPVRLPLPRGGSGRGLRARLELADRVPRGAGIPVGLACALALPAGPAESQSGCDGRPIINYVLVADCSRRRGIATGSIEARRERWPDAKLSLLLCPPGEALYPQTLRSHPAPAGPAARQSGSRSGGNRRRGTASISAHPTNAY